MVIVEIVMIYLYCRVSSNKQTEGLSLSLQGDKKLLDEIAKKYDDQVSSKIYEDEGVSAFSGDNEKKGALKNLLDDIESGLIQPDDIIVMRHLDRLSRQTLSKSMKIFSGILDNGVDIYTTLEGRLYSSSDSEVESISMILASLSFKLAHEESLKKQYLTNKSALKRVEQFKNQEFHSSGKPFSIGLGGVPFHCKIIDKSIQEHPRQFSIAKELVSYVMAGNGYFKTQKWLESTHGIAMSTAGIKNLLRSKALYGHLSMEIKDLDAISRMKNGRIKRKRKNGKLDKKDTDDVFHSKFISEDGYFPEVITESEWYQLQSRLDQKSSKGNKKHDTLLSGRRILQCGECKSSMSILYSTNNSKDGKPVYYFCSKCKNAEKIYTINSIVLSSLAIHDLKYDDQEIIDKEMKRLKAEIDYKDDELAEISSTYADNSLKRENKTLKNKMISLSAELDGLDDEYQKYKSKSFKNIGKVALEFLISEKTKIIDEIMADDTIINEKYGVLIAQVVNKIVINKDGLVDISTNAGHKYYYLPNQSTYTGRRMGYSLTTISENDPALPQIRMDKNMSHMVFTEKEISAGKYRADFDDIHPSLLRLYSEPHTEKQAIDKFMDKLKVASELNPLILTKKTVMSRTDITDKQWNTYRKKATAYMVKHKLFNIKKKAGEYVVHYNILNV